MAMHSNKTVYQFSYVLICILILTCFHLNVWAQNKKVILLGFYAGNYNDGATTNTASTESVPCPLDSNSLPKTNTWYYDRLAQQANIIAASGFTAVWLPPMAKGGLGYSGPSTKQIIHVGGIYDTGYGLFDHYDLGDKLQKGNYQTRYGSRTQLTRCIAMFRANGLDAYEDFVTNQVSILANVTPVAPTYLWYQYQNAFDSVGGGRFPKYTPDFHNPPIGAPGAPNGSQDPDVPATTYPNGMPTGQTEGFFGPDFAHITGEQNINGYPGVWCATQLGLWGDWLIRATGIQGYRLDDASGISWDFLKGFVNYGAMKGKFSVTELAGSPYGVADLKTWMQTSMGHSDDNFTMFDQVLQGALGALCKTDKFYIPVFQSKYMSYGAINQMNPAAGTQNQGAYDIYRSLLVADTAQVVTVVNEVDSETGPNPVLPNQCLIGYAYILTVGFGIPCIAYRDWSTDAGCYGSTMIDSNNLNYHLNKLIWCHNFICSGGFTNEYGSPNGWVYSFQKTGGQQAMVLLNSNQDAAVPAAVPTSIPNGTVLTDYTDHNITATVTNGSLTVTVPANKNGRGYLVMAPPGITGAFAVNKTSVTQEWDASDDLSIPPASNNEQEVCRIWVDNGQPVTATMLAYNITNWSKNTNLTLEIDKSSLDNKTNTALASRKFNSAQQNQSLNYTTPASGGPGYYSLWVKGNDLPVNSGYEWFNLQNTYTASQTAPSDFNDTVPTLKYAVKPPPVQPDTLSHSELYPDPASNMITAIYRLTTSAPVSLKIINIDGRVIFKEEEGVQAAGIITKTINVAGFSSGVYILRVQSGNTVIISKKFIKN
jgi:alpha-amylase